MSFCENTMHMSWKFPINLLFKLQKRLFKAAYVLDNKKLFDFQKLILQSNCARLLAIREVTQLSSDKDISGIDGKISLNFSEKFQLNEYLKLNWNNWKVQSLRKVLYIKNKEHIGCFKIPTVSDRIWQTLVKFAIEPVHEALFHPFSYGFRFNISIYEVQKNLIFNLSKISFGKQKRLIYLDISKATCYFKYNYLINKVIAPRNIKLTIFKFLEKGFVLEFPDDTIGRSTFSSLLLNILLDGIETLHHCIRYGYYILFFLRPNDDETFLINNLQLFIRSLGLDLKSLKIKTFSSCKNFDFLNWNFKITNKTAIGLYIRPSYTNYQSFLKKVKRITNNSNYGSLIKVFKLFPIIKDWKTYHKYSHLKGLSYSLFFVRKRIFKVFNSESKQDFYSSKRLLSKCFSVSNLVNGKKVNDIFNIKNIKNFGHVVYLINFNNSLNGLNLCFCIHCGMKII